MSKPIFSSWGGKLIDLRSSAARPASSKKTKLPWQFDETRVAAVMGWDGLVVASDKINVVDMVRAYLEEAQKLSCGECSLCWIGIDAMVNTLTRIVNGQGKEEDIDLLARLGKGIKEDAKCNFGRTAMVPVLDTIEYYREQYLEIIRSKKPVPKSDYKVKVTAPCMEACPAHLDVPGYIELIRNERYNDSLNLIRKGVCLPGTVGRVCVAFCEENCVRKDVDGHLAIRALKRYVADQVIEQGIALSPTKAKKTREKVAIIGAGPAGLAAGYNLAQKGYRVTIFEELPVSGGMAAVGIPQYRLPKDVLNTEVMTAEGMGVEIKLGTRIGRDATIDNLWQDAYKAIFIAVGAHQSRKIGAKGEEQGYVGFIDGVKFLRDLNLGRRIEPKSKVLVIGGGDVAIDCARSCVRVGFKEVRILYRRSRLEMPARKEEVEAAEEEGIKIDYLVTPIQILVNNGKVSGVECIKMELGEPDESGRRRPIPVKGSEFTIKTEVVISAIGQIPDLSFITSEDRVEVTKDMTIKVTPDICQTGRKGIFSGGDCVTGPAVLIDAMATGNRVAECIDQYLREGTIAPSKDAKMKALIQDIDFYDQREKVTTERKAPQALDHVPVEDRIHSFAEVEHGFNPKAASEEAKRCLRCYRIMLLALTK